MVIDAYNVLYADPQLNKLVRQDLEKARQEFLALVARQLPTDGTVGIVVFDAMREPRPTTETGRTSTAYERGLRVVYARESADTWICNHVRQHDDPTLVTVVTSDREILASVRAHRAQTLRVSEFLQLAARRRDTARRARETEKPGHQSRR